MDIIGRNIVHVAREEILELFQSWAGTNSEMCANRALRKFASPTTL